MVDSANNNKKEGGKDVSSGNEVVDEEDIIDERGFVDGVKVARKCSKANVLGKAVEYIRYVRTLSISSSTALNHNVEKCSQESRNTPKA